MTATGKIQVYGSMYKVSPSSLLKYEDNPARKVEIAQRK
jgi:hypothetical protein